MVEAEAARATPGVRAVVTGADLTWCDPYFGPAFRDRPILAIDVAVAIRVAILMTIRNEAPARAFRRLREVKRSLDATGAGASFDWFVLSDTSIDAVGAQEEAEMAAWRAGEPADAGISIAMVEACAREGLPLLGVCLGHQAIGVAFGGRIVRARTLMHGKVSRISHDEIGRAHV